MLNFNEIEGFDWDRGNVDKNLDKHNVTNIEIEEVFFDQDILLYLNEKHSTIEVRYYCLGKTFIGRRLYISFTLRNNKIRAISARDMSKNERKIYDK